MTLRRASSRDDALGLIGLLGLAAGLSVLPSTLTWDARGVVDGVAGQIGTTLGAAVLTVLASGANLLAGAILVRLAIRRPFQSVAELVLVGFAGAVLLDLVLIFVLAGPQSLFRAPLVAAICLILCLVGGRTRPLLAAPFAPVVRPSLLWVLIGVAWSGPILLQLASPVPPFMDVLPNHVAPVEHLRVFGSFEPLTTSPSPIYGPSRISLGYVALLGAVSTLTGLPAALSTSAFIWVEVGLVALGIYYLADAATGRMAAMWALLMFTLTQAFVRLPDDRARILALPLATLTLALLIQEMRRADVSGRSATHADRIIPIAVALGATFLMHAVIGALTAATVLLVALLASARAARLVVPALFVAGALSLLQAAVMLGLQLPAAAGLAVLPLVVAGLMVGMRAEAVNATVRLAGIGFAALALLVVALLMLRPATLLDTLDLLPAGILLIGSLAGLILVRRRISRLVLAAGLSIGLLAGLAAYLLPSTGASPLVDSLRYEVPKEVRTWLPLFLALYAAAAVAIVLRWAAPRLRVRRGWSAAVGSLAFILVSLLVVVAALPLRTDPIDQLYVGERRISESLAGALRTAERGYWVGYPDNRRLVDAQQEQMLQVLRGEAASGRINANTQLLHVAASFQHWASIPIGVFTGIRESLVSVETEDSVHTQGGRLYPLTDLARLLVDAPLHYRYVVLEPSGLPSEVEDSIIEAGYEPIHADRRAIVFRATVAAAMS